MVLKALVSPPRFWRSYVFPEGTSRSVGPIVSLSGDTRRHTNLPPPAMLNPRLLVELLDHIVDFLSGEKKCFGSVVLSLNHGSPVPRRKHLLLDINFGDLQSWKNTSPGPSTSPACYTKTLSITRPHFATATGTEPGRWIAHFPQVVNLEVRGITTGGASQYRPNLST